MIHISGYFAYLTMVWSRCSRISEGPLYNEKLWLWLTQEQASLWGKLVELKVAVKSFSGG